MGRGGGGIAIVRGSDFEILLRLYLEIELTFQIQIFNIAMVSFEFLFFIQILLCLMLEYLCF